MHTVHSPHKSGLISYRAFSSCDPNLRNLESHPHVRHTGAHVEFVMTICAIVGCKKRSAQGVLLHQIPAVREDRSPRELELTKQRRAGFLAAIRHKIWI